MPTEPTLVCGSFLDPELPDATYPRLRTALPCQDEICAAIKALKNNKAEGLDGIPAELLQAAPMTSSELLQPLIETEWISECFPGEWKKGMIVKLPKKEA